MTRPAPAVVIFGLIALLEGCASTGSTGSPAAFPGSSAETRAAAGARAETLVQTALALRGVPYRLGGADPALGVDCSGLVQYVFFQHEVRLPRTVGEQQHVGRGVNRSHVAAGDLIFFAIDAREPTHVGIAIGGGMFVHAPGSGRTVRVEHFNTTYWQSRLKAVRRVPLKG
ncbi:MAG: C40 family peptidase [Vicinamibacterales bacterium]